MAKPPWDPGAPAPPTTRLPVMVVLLTESVEFRSLSIPPPDACGPGPTPLAPAMAWLLARMLLVIVSWQFRKLKIPPPRADPTNAEFGAGAPELSPLSPPRARLPSMVQPEIVM